MKTVLVLALVFFANSALADVVGTYSTGKKSDKMTIYYKNDDSIRIAVAAESYMLITDQKVYMVSQHNGKTTAMDMDKLGELSKQMGGMRPKVEAPHANKNDTTFKKTGRTETIAGYKGDVYEVTTDGTTQEFVATKDKDVVTLNKAFYQMARRMSESLGQNRAQELDATIRMAEAEKMGGMLRFSNDMVLQSLTKQEMGAEFYKLPAGSELQEMPDIPDMNNIMKQAEAAAAEQRAAAKSQQPDVASEMANEASDAARDETKNQIRDGVQSAIRGLFGK